MESDALLGSFSSPLEASFVTVQEDVEQPQVEVSLGQAPARNLGNFARVIDPPGGGSSSPSQACRDTTWADSFLQPREIP